MASELSVDAVRDFIALNDGRVKNTTLVAHFRKFLNDPNNKSEARQKFKDCVNGVAVVKTEHGEKYVQLKKKYRTAAPMTAVSLPPPEIPESHSAQASPNHISSFDNPILPDSDTPVLYAATSMPPPPTDTDLSFTHSSADTLQFADGQIPSSSQSYFEPPTFSNNTMDDSVSSEKRPSMHETYEESRPPAPQMEPTLPAPRNNHHHGGVKVSSHEVFPDLKPEESQLDPTGQFRVPLAPGRKQTKENVPPSFVVSEIHQWPRNKPTGAVERARLNFQAKKSDGDDTSSIAQSERSVDSNKDQDQEFDDDRPVAPFAMDPMEKRWMLTAARGNMVELRKLLNTDPNLAEKKDFMMGYTALHWAAKKGNMDLVKMFGDAGVDVNVKSNGGYTPLHLAAMHGHEKVLQVLVEEYEADTIIRDYTGKQARDYLRTGSISLPIQKILFGNNGTGSIKDFAAGLRPRLDSVRKSKRLGNAISGGVGVLGAIVRGKSTSSEDVSSITSQSPSLGRKESFKTKMKKKTRKWSRQEDRPSISLVSSYDESDSGFGGGISGASSMSSMPEIAGMRRGHSSSPNISRPPSTHSRDSVSSRPRGESTGSRRQAVDGSDKPSS